MIYGSELTEWPWW